MRHWPRDPHVFAIETGKVPKEALKVDNPVIFDRKRYQREYMREYMRKRRAKAREG